MPTDGGPFYFAWVEPEETTFGIEHQVWDEEIVRFSREQSEGECAKLIIDIRNPRTGPYAASRQVWAWFSWQSDSDVVPLFFGRVVSVSNILGEIITYELHARPSDYQQQQQTLADSLRVLPYYDEIFIDPDQRENPDVVLEGYGALWHCNPVTHEVSVSDPLIGEEGVAVFTGDEVVRDSVRLDIARAPLQSVTVKGSFPWTQRSSATIDMGSRRFLTYTGGSLISGWPKTGDSLAGGYYVVSASANDDLGIGKIEPVSWSINYQNRQKRHNDGDLMSYSESFSGPPGNGSTGGPLGGTTIYDFIDLEPGDPFTGTPASYSRNRNAVMVPLWQVSTTLVLGIDAERERKDNLEFTLASDLQPVLNDPADTSGSETIDLPSADVAVDCGSDPSAIVNASRYEYITTDRGNLSLQYMLLRARAKLRVGARIAETSWDCPFGLAVNLNCRMNAQLFDDRIPGEAALGKIVFCALRGDSSTGEFRGSVRIACAVGNGTAIATQTGEPDYVEEGYVEQGYQTYTGQIVALDTGDVGFGSATSVSGGGLSFFPTRKSDIVVREEVFSTPGDQGDAIAAALKGMPPFSPQLNFYAFYQKFNQERVRLAAEALASTQLWYELELKDLTSPGIEKQWTAPTVPLVIPRQIDLTADASV